MRLSLRWKWLMVYLLLVGGVLIFVMRFLSARLETYFQQRFENRWQRELLLVKKFVEATDFTRLTVKQVDQMADQIGQVLGMRVTLISFNGVVLGDSEVAFEILDEIENHGGRPEVLQAQKEGFGKSVRSSTTIHIDLVYLAVPFNIDEDSQGIIRVAVPVSEIQESLEEIHQILWLAATIAFTMVLIFGFVISRTTMWRLQEMARAAQRFARGDFSKKIVTHGQDELSDLGFTLNQMADDLQTNLAQITNQRNWLKTILDSMVEGVLVLDLSGKILLANQAFYSLFQISQSLVDKPIHGFIRNQPLLDAIQVALNSLPESGDEIELLDFYQKKINVHISVMHTADKPDGVVLVFHDITRLQHLEEVRRDFVANVSHELQTPLTTIKGFAETLLDSPDITKNQSQNFLEKILRSTNRMSKLVRDLLLLSKSESELMSAGLSAVDLAEIISSVARNYDKTAADLNVKLVLEIPANLPQVSAVAADVETVLGNLLDNAFHYGASGGKITVTVSELPDEVKVDVIDYGAGILVEEQSRIFERFYRVDKGRSRALGGTGLGLSIVKHIVQRFGGRVLVESEIGKGAKFSFTLLKVKS
ncbi:MAG: ATP-binding protein [bacterium]